MAIDNFLVSRLVYEFDILSYELRDIISITLNAANTTTVNNRSAVAAALSLWKKHFAPNNLLHLNLVRTEINEWQCDSVKRQLTQEMSTQYRINYSTAFQLLDFYYKTLPLVLELNRSSKQALVKQIVQKG